VRGNFIAAALAAQSFRSSDLQVEAILSKPHKGGTKGTEGLKAGNLPNFSRSLSR